MFFILCVIALFLPTGCSEEPIIFSLSVRRFRKKAFLYKPICRKEVTEVTKETTLMGQGLWRSFHFFQSVTEETAHSAAPPVISLIKGAPLETSRGC